MWSARRVGTILAYAAIPLLLVVGSVALAVTEGVPAPKAAPTLTSSPAPATRTQMPQPSHTETPTSAMAAEPAAGPTANPTPRRWTCSPSCPLPAARGFPAR